MKFFFPCDMKKKDEILPDIYQLEKIFMHINDERSREIFEHRLLYSLSMDDKYIVDIIRTENDMIQLGRKLFGRPYIYGAGKRAQKLVKIFSDINWRGYIDKNRIGTLEELPIFDLSILPKVIKEDEAVIISIKEDAYNVRDMLIRKGISDQKIVMFQPYIDGIYESIYFDSSCLGDLNRCDGCFVDIGCYDGADTLNALSYFSDQELAVYSFEPDPNNYQICKQMLNNIKSVHLYPYGICSNTGTLFISQDGAGSRLMNYGVDMVRTINIDEFMKNEKVGFIKMDIEGYEEDALEGGKETIYRDKPILAMSVYHKRSDIWRLPLKVLECFSGYRLCFRHYSLSWSDTVMYAIP